jgi:hypothetical protein
MAVNRAADAVNRSEVNSPVNRAVNRAVNSSERHSFVFMLFFPMGNVMLTRLSIDFTDRFH